MDQDTLDDRIQRYYAHHVDESVRLTSRAAGRVELARVRELVAPRLAPGSHVLDVGGAAGVHATWLAAEGHHVTLLDPVRAQVDAARRIGTFTADVGDARALPAADASYDAVLIAGPLYHLATRDDRLQALREAARVLRPGGLVFAGAISRTVAALDAVLRRRFTDLPGVALTRLLETGEVADEIRNPEGEFPGAHFHTAAELAEELVTAGFHDASVTGLEGPGSIALEFAPADDDVVAAALVLARRTQQDPEAVDLSSHLLGIAVR
ncbi:class I SAM-dependent methyltransferase [Cellulomonas phragmiteti]|uniref:Methyltransferase domain-containing protein n=1 Tax=Cellulomonas phragmiteti TaxID=478780 RepID=A0ABQ4DQ56_9CELL|nr:class I SAM-dependent methyltransferase [Cellulomonas phragmiteti]GIG41473.1 hypothetical protein Cph01nite_32350 [Cellulomonas phragmiteti]